MLIDYSAASDEQNRVNGTNQMWFRLGIPKMQEISPASASQDEQKPSKSIKIRYKGEYLGR